MYEFTNLRIYEFTENYCRRDLCIQGDDDNLSLDDTSKKLAWKQHYERLLNIEFPWSHVDPVVSPAQFITLKTLKEWESGWTPGVVADLRNAIILEGKVQDSLDSLDSLDSFKRSISQNTENYI